MTTSVGHEPLGTSGVAPSVEQGEHIGGIRMEIGMSIRLMKRRDNDRRPAIRVDTRDGWWEKYLNPASRWLPLSSGFILGTHHCFAVRECKHRVSPQSIGLTARLSAHHRGPVGVFRLCQGWALIWIGGGLTCGRRWAGCRGRWGSGWAVDPRGGGLTDRRPRVRIDTWGRGMDAPGTGGGGEGAVIDTDTESGPRKHRPMRPG